eukprot:3874855-Prymnesium_polylepis.1
MGKKEQTFVKTSSRLVRHIEGEVLYKQGTSAEIFYVVQSGRWEASDEQKNGTVQVLRHYEAFDYFGSADLLYGTARAVTLTCIEAGAWQRLLD